MSCPVCHKEDCQSGSILHGKLERFTKVTLPVKRLSRYGVLMDRGDGHRFRVKGHERTAFLRRNPRGFEVGA
jgi:hypothetical protein